MAEDATQRRILYRGDFQPDLECALEAEVRAATAADPLARRLILVPSHLLKLHLRRLLAARGRPHVDLHFLTLLELARRLAEPVFAERGLAALPDLGRELLARTLAAEVPVGSYFGRIRGARGFAARLAATLRDARDAGIEAGALGARFQHDAKIRALADILARFERRLADARIADDASTFALAGERARGGADLGFEGPPFIYGYYDFTGVQRRFLEQWIELHGGVAFAPIGRGSAYEYALPTLRFFERAGFTAAPPGEATPPATALALLRERLFEEPPGGAPAAPEDGSVRIVSCPSARREAREVVRAARDCAGDGIPLYEVGVLARSSAVAVEVDDAFDELEAAAELGPDQCPPRYLHGGRPQGERRAAAAARLWLAAVRGGLHRRAVFEWLHFSGADPDALALERVALAANVVGGDPLDWQLRLDRGARRILWRREALEAVESLAGEAFDDERGGAAADRAALAADERLLLRLRGWIERLEAARVALATCRSFAEFADRAAAHAEACAAAGPAADEASGRALEPLGELSALDRLALPFDGAAAFDLAESALAAAVERAGRFQEGAFLGALLAARGLSFAAVVLPRLLDGVFPRGAAEDPILLDEERRAVAAALLGPGEVGLPLAARSAEEDRLLFRLAIGAARERLVLTFPRLEPEQGRELLPSPLLLAAASALAGRAVAAEDIAALAGTEVVPVSPWRGPAALRPLDLREFDRTRIARAVRAGRPEGVRFLWKVHPPALAALRAELARWQSSRFTAWDGMLLRPDRGRRNAVLSPSRLEDYAACPFTYFARVILRLPEAREAPEDVDALTALDRGQIVHRILEAFFREVAGSEPFPLQAARREELRDRLRARAGEEFQRFEISGLTGFVLAYDEERRRIVEDLLRFLDAELERGSSLRPVALEAAFGQRGGAPPLELAIGAPPLRFAGSIDRVDADLERGRAAVVDYKTGAAQRKWDGGLDGGRSLQLPLYALAVERVVAPGLGRALAALSAEYVYCTRRGELARRSVDPSLWRGGRAHELKQVLEVVTGGIEDGAFFADPTDDSRCQNCSFRLACGRGAGLEERFLCKSSDPAAVALLALRGATAGQGADSGDQA